MTEPDAPPTDHGEPTPTPARDQFQDLGVQTSRRAARSSLLRWLEQLYDTLGPDHGRIHDWRPACEAAVAAGVRGGNGQLPTPRLIASQWRKIRRRRTALAVKAREAAALPGGGSPAPTPATVPVPVLPSVLPGAQPDRRRPSELACGPPTLLTTADPVELTAEEKRRRGQAEADRVFGELRAASHRKYGFGRLEGEA